VDFVSSAFRLNNSRGYFVPAFNFSYQEEGTDIQWRCTCDGTRAYMIRFGTPLSHDMDEQAAESHFMVRRITASLLLSGFGLFIPEPTGRVLFTDVWGDAVNFTAQLDHPTPDLCAMEEGCKHALYGWIGALSAHTMLRRAAEDAHTALTHPHDALVCVYRGLEWLVVGLGTTWENIGSAIGATTNEMRELKKMANVDLGVRHASKTGTKMRADPFNYGTWVIGLFDAINAVRERLEPGFTKMTMKETGEAVARAAPFIPFE
jgi:hypothetical protein